MNDITAYVRGRLQVEEEKPPPRVVQISPRITEDHVELLDVMAEQLRLSRTALAADLLEIAIVEGSAALGIQWVPTEDGGQEIGIFGSEDDA